MVIDDVIQCTLEYMPQQICKEFVWEHGMHLTYVQAWNIKEKAKERIYGQSKNFYKLLPWMCQRIKKCDPRSVVELTHSGNGNFQQLFIAHEVSIIGFLSGCRSIIVIDSSHMSRSYGGTLFSATTYDVNDNMLRELQGLELVLTKLKESHWDKDVVIL